MPELLLDEAFIDLRRARETGAQAVAREQGEAVFFGQVCADTGFQDGGLDEAHDMFVIEPGL